MSVANSFNVLSNTSILANISIPPNTYTGDYDVYVYNSIDGWLELHNGIYINGVTPPSLVSINPNTANAGETLNVTITGVSTHFSQGSGTYIDFEFNQGSTTVVNSINILSNTSILANINVPTNTYTGDYNVYVYNSIDDWLGLCNGIHINGVTPPSLVSINPNTGIAGQTLDVTITGVSTHFSQGSGTYIDFEFNQGSGTTVVNSLTTLSNTSILANITIPSNTIVGDYNVYAYNNSIDGDLTLYDGFHVGTNSVLGITDEPFSLNIYPNPAKYNITVDIALSSIRSDYIISIYNIQGQLILQKPLILAQTEINVESFTKGLYILKVENKDGTISRKFVKE